MTDESNQPTQVSEGGSRRLPVTLSSLYLDPNNYRFVDHDDYVAVPDEHVTDEEVQRRTRRLILGANEENVSDLVASLKENGWLDVEPIHVRKLADGRYLVVEGNRRVATLNHMHSRWQDATGQLGKLDSNIFERVPCILYDERDDFHHLVVMGLHHISGKARWPAVNQARLMKRLRDEFKKAPDDICASLGVSRREFNLSLRTLALADAYRNSDFGDQFTTEMFNLFREVLKSPSLRNWLAWDNEAEHAKDAANLERLFSWLSREPEEEPEDEDERPTGRKYLLGERVITTGGQIRELAKVIEDPTAVKRLEETRSLQAATLSSDLLVKNEIEGALERSNQDAIRLFELAPKMSSTELDKIEGVVARLSAVSLSRKRQPEYGTQSELPWAIQAGLGRGGFGSVRITRYRGLSHLTFNSAGRVNLVVGTNNAGKTSILEAIYLLAQQSDPRAIVEVVRRRARIDPIKAPSFAVAQIPASVSVEGSFADAMKVSVEIKTRGEPTDADEDWSDYLKSLVITGACGATQQSSVTEFFTGRPRRTRIKGEPRWLCPAVLHSPFSLSEPDLLVRCNESSIKAKSKERVIAFIRKHLDPGVEDIALVNDQHRFLVTHRDAKEAVDLSVFGEGLQRVFLTGLLFAGVPNGLVLLDEFENALHTSVLLEFTRFVHEMAFDFDVQVFLTTHSKETVDAFLLNGYLPEEVVAYLLKRDETGRSVLRFAGPSLKRAIEVGDVDLRRL